MIPKKERIVLHQKLKRADDLNKSQHALVHHAARMDGNATEGEP
jgi:hypothetical protein